METFPRERVDRDPSVLIAISQRVGPKRPGRHCANEAAVPTGNSQHQRCDCRRTGRVDGWVRTRGRPTAIAYRYMMGAHRGPAVRRMLACSRMACAHGIGAAPRGGNGAARVSSADANALYQALVHGNRPISYGDCFNSRRGVTSQTRDAYGLLLATARQNPDATLQGPDDTTDHLRVRAVVAEWEQAIGFCMSHEPSVGAGWQQLIDQFARFAARASAASSGLA